MEPVSVAALFTAFAKAAGAAFGKEMAKQFVELVFGHLATEEDIQRAVLEINSHTTRVMADHEVRILKVELASGKESLEFWRRNNKEDDLRLARDHISSAVNWFKERKNADRRSLYLQFVPLAKALSTDVAIYAAWVTHIDTEPEMRPLFVARVKEHAELIELAITEMEKFAKEKVEDIQAGSSYDLQAESLSTEVSTLLRGGDVGPPERGELQWRAGFYINGQRYSGGRTELRGDWQFSEEKARAQVKPWWDRERARAALEKEFREKQLYQPARTFSTAVQGLESGIMAFSPA
ncbi:hypothetical protein [Sinorhizobium meliloti]|uniref:Uncharacterized protein n=1 Tax=Rhizobium meliloti TaxID=382 RepID=A0AAW9U8W6_RHIML|nr:hypothetical protein [Sinorhizobium meliloti]MQW38190.1 hypothetical protein [Sinorhizobium meliloti]